MIRLLILLAILFAVALGFHRLKATSGQVSLTLGDTAYAVDLTTAVIGLIVAMAAAVLVVWIVRAILRAPHRFSRSWRRRRADKGRNAISQGLIAIAAGDLRTAERAAADAARRTPDMPLTRLLQAQTAILKGDHGSARQTFQDMTEDPETRLVGMRGLYVEAERDGEMDAARLIAERAHEENPAASWAARALLRHQTGAADWGGALKTLSGAADGRVLDKATARRHRAVILTAQALQQEDSDPESARLAAMEAHELAPDLVPAAAAAGRLLSRLGDIRRATRVLETAWKANPHPELAEAYLHVRSGDSATDRLRRAEALFRMRADSDVGRLAVARAAIDARDFERAREVLTPILTQRPTQSALMLMAELEESETGNRARAREWQARAVRAPRDPAWTADGVILAAWAPASPVTGRIDAVEWKVPVSEIERPRLEINAADLLAEPIPVPDIARVGAEPTLVVESDIGSGPESQRDELPASVSNSEAAEPQTVPAERDPVALEPEPGELIEVPARPVLQTDATLSGAADPVIDEADEPLPTPPIPDDPGVGGDGVDREERRRYRLF